MDVKNAIALTRTKSVMNVTTPFWQITMSVLVCSGLTSCAMFAQLGLNVSSIENLQNNPKPNATVYIRGRVGDSVPLIDSSTYQLKDATGSIWVVTDQPIPSPGVELLIEGKVYYQSISLEGQELGEVYLQEVKKLEENL